MYISQEDKTKLVKVQTIVAKMVQRMEQLPCQKRLERPTLLSSQEEMAEAGVGIVAEVCKIMGVENNVKAEWVSMYPIMTELWYLRKLVVD